MTTPAPPTGLQLDLLSAVRRLEQVAAEQTAPDDLIFERVLTCDLPRLRAHLDADTLAWERSELDAMIPARRNPQETP